MSGYATFPPQPQDQERYQPKQGNVFVTAIRVAVIIAIVIAIFATIAWALSKLSGGQLSGSANDGMSVVLCTGSPDITLNSATYKPSDGSAPTDVTAAMAAKLRPGTWYTVDSATLVGKATPGSLAYKYKCESAKHSDAFHVLDARDSAPDAMEHVGTRASSLMAAIGRRPAAPIGGLPGSWRSRIEVDTDFAGDQNTLKETLTSSRRMDPNTLAAHGTGLGTIRSDPRFEPGSRAWAVGGDANPAHGGHAGGPTHSGFSSREFRPSAGWDGYVHARP